jgi:hypothetical protein
MSNQNQYVITTLANKSISNLKILYLDWLIFFFIYLDANVMYGTYSLLFIYMNYRNNIVIWKQKFVINYICSLNLYKFNVLAPRCSSVYSTNLRKIFIAGKFSLYRIPSGRKEQGLELLETKNKSDFDWWVS